MELTRLMQLFLPLCVSVSGSLPSISISIQNKLASPDVSGRFKLPPTAQAGSLPRSTSYRQYLPICCCLSVYFVDLWIVHLGIIGVYPLLLAIIDVIVINVGHCRYRPDSNANSRGGYSNPFNLIFRLIARVIAPARRNVIDRNVCYLDGLDV